MPRPKTKAELLDLSQKNFKRLTEFVDSFSNQEKNTDFPEGTMNRNIRDVFTHLHHWHLMLIEWYTIGMSGQKPEMPAKGYTWKTLPDLNRVIFEKYRDTELEAAGNLLNDSFNDAQKLIRKHSNDELFEKKRYKWTGTTSLGAYLISATSSHYDWAYKLIKKAKK